MMRSVTRTTVGIVGGGPAGLMLSHLLSIVGVDSVVVDHRTRDEIENTVRAGILEADSVRLLTDTGVSDRVHRDGIAHQGIDLRFGGQNHRIDFQGLVGERSWLYPQTDVFIDLADARDRDGGDVRFGVRDTRVVDVTSDRPGILCTDADGARPRGALRLPGRRRRVPVDLPLRDSPERCGHTTSGSTRSPGSASWPRRRRAHPSSSTLTRPRGFALISQRTETLQRMYFQCEPEEDINAWSDDRIWTELQARVAGPDGFTLKEGPITDKAVLRFRSFVAEPMRHGRLLLAGDAAHTVPPTGAKGLNLALADVRVLAEVLERAVRNDDAGALDEYGPRALARVWKAQHFSYWMTTMLHALPDATVFDLRRQLGELESVASSAAGSTYLAEAYTGWPRR